MRRDVPGKEVCRNCQHWRGLSVSKGRCEAALPVWAHGLLRSRRGAAPADRCKCFRQRRWARSRARPLRAARTNPRLQSIEAIRSQCEVDANGCWIWQHRRNLAGYAQASQGGKDLLVHRVALALVLGRPLVGLACHRCDVKGCVNPAHLYEGTAKDNARDVTERMPEARRRSAARSAKLTAGQVASARQAVALGASLGIIAQAAGVTFGAMRAAVRGDTWKEVDFPPVSDETDGTTSGGPTPPALADRGP